MKLSKQQLADIFDDAADFDGSNEQAFDARKALLAGTLEIEGYVREDHFADAGKMVDEWTKFDPDNESTYPPNKTHVLVYGLSDNMRDDEKLCGIDVDFWLNDHFVCYCNITHWRPLPKPPQESEAGK